MARRRHRAHDARRRCLRRRSRPLASPPRMKHLPGLFLACAGALVSCDRADDPRWSAPPAERAAEAPSPAPPRARAPLLRLALRLAGSGVDAGGVRHVRHPRRRVRRGTPHLVARDRTDAHRGAQRGRRRSARHRQHHARREAHPADPHHPGGGQAGSRSRARRHQRSQFRAGTSRPSSSWRRRTATTASIRTTSTSPRPSDPGRPSPPSGAPSPRSSPRSRAPSTAGKTLSLAVPADTEDCGVYDDDALSALADQVHLMGYDYHYEQGPHAGPVSPLGWYPRGRGPRRDNRRRAPPGPVPPWVPNYGLVGPGVTVCSPSTSCLKMAGRRVPDDHAPHGRLLDGARQFPGAPRTGRCRTGRRCSSTTSRPWRRR